MNVSFFVGGLVGLPLGEEVGDLNGFLVSIVVGLKVSDLEGAVNGRSGKVGAVDGADVNCIVGRAIALATAYCTTTPVYPLAIRRDVSSAMRLFIKLSRAALLVPDTVTAYTTLAPSSCKCLL